MKTGMFESISGNKSSSRLYGGAVIFYAMLMAFLVLYWGKNNSESIIELATAAALTFTTIGGSAMVFLFQQKKTEIKQELKDEQND